MPASTVLSAYPLSETFDKDCAFTRQNGMYAADITLSRSTSGSGSSDSEAPSLTASDQSSTSASSTELDSPSDGDEDFSLDGASTGIPSPFVLSPRRLDTPCTPLLLRECGGRFPFPVMDQQDAGYESDSDKKASKRAAAVRPRLRRAGSALLHAKLLVSSEAGARNRSRSLLAPASPPPEVSEATVSAAAKPMLPPSSPTLVRGNGLLKIDLPPPTVPREDAQTPLGRGLPSRLINGGRRAASGPMPAAPRLCATLVDPRSPSPLDLPSPLCSAPHPPRRARGQTIVGLISSVLSTSRAVPRRLATNKHQVPPAPPPTPCTPRRMMQQHRSLLAPREAPPRLAAWKKPESPVEQLTSSASAHNPYFDNAVIVPGVGAMLASSAAALLLS